MTNDNKQLCMITAVFEITDDALAIELKRKVSSVFSELENVRIDFRLTQTKQETTNGTDRTGIAGEN